VKLRLLSVSLGVCANKILRIILVNGLILHLLKKKLIVIFYFF